MTYITKSNKNEIGKYAILFDEFLEIERSYYNELNNKGNTKITHPNSLLSMATPRDYSKEYSNKLSALQKHPYIEWIKKSSSFIEAYKKFSEKDISRCGIPETADIEKLDLETTLASIIAWPLKYYYYITEVQVASGGIQTLTCSDSNLNSISCKAQSLLKEIRGTQAIERGLLRTDFLDILEIVTNKQSLYEIAESKKRYIIKRNHERAPRQIFIQELATSYAHHLSYINDKCTDQPDRPHSSVLIPLINLVDPNGIDKNRLNEILKKLWEDLPREDTATT